MGFIDGFRRGLARGRHESFDDEPDPWLEDETWPPERPAPEFAPPRGGEDEAAAALVEELQQRIDSLEAELETRDAMLAESKNLLRDLAALVEQLQARIVELESTTGAAQPFIAVLLLPGVKMVLVNMFHPDRYADADATEQRTITGWFQTITAAYEMIERDKPDPAAD